jgi:hypothetical protein
MACIRQLHIGGSMTDYGESHNVVDSAFHNLFKLSLDCHWDILGIYIKLPTTKEDIDHVENV